MQKKKKKKKKKSATLDDDDEWELWRSADPLDDPRRGTTTRRRAILPVQLDNDWFGAAKSANKLNNNHNFFLMIALDRI